MTRPGFGHQLHPSLNHRPSFKLHVLFSIGFQKCFVSNKYRGRTGGGGPLGYSCRVHKRFASPYHQRRRMVGFGLGSKHMWKLKDVYMWGASIFASADASRFETRCFGRGPGRCPPVIL